MRLQQYLNEGLSFVPFDKDIFNAIEGKEKMYLKEKEGTYYTMVVDGEKVGIIGFAEKGDYPFLQVGIIKEFRGQGYLELAVNELVKKHELKILYATIDKSNERSIKSISKLGFKPVPKEEEVEARKGRSKGKQLHGTEIRLYKEF
jgi:RimJ/RimL family protein N-acetyltransferase